MKKIYLHMKSGDVYEAVAPQADISSWADTFLGSQCLLEFDIERGIVTGKAYLRGESIESIEIEGDDDDE